jgi:selenide,water dikinase
MMISLREGERAGETEPLVLVLVDEREAPTYSGSIPAWLSRAQVPISIHLDEWIASSVGREGEEGGEGVGSSVARAAHEAHEVLGEQGGRRCYGGLVGRRWVHVCRWRAAATNVDVEGRRVGLRVGEDETELWLRVPRTRAVASLNVGSTVGAGIQLDDGAPVLATRPIGVFVARLEERLSAEEAPRSVVVVGGGIASVELACAVRARLGPSAALTLITRGPAKELLARQRGWLTSWLVRSSLTDRGIRVVGGETVTAVTADGAVLGEAGRHLGRADLVLLATGPAPPGLLRTGTSVGVPRCRQGFVDVGPSLVVPGLPWLFASGDCATIRGADSVARAGVYSVRAGPILARNWMHTLRGEPVEEWEPQTDFLALIDRGDDSAIASKFGLSLASRGMGDWKRSIDASFMAVFGTNVQNEFDPQLVFENRERRL